MTFLDYSKINSRNNGDVQLLIENDYYSTTGDYDCREELSYNFIEEITGNDELPDLNVGVSKVTIVVTCNEDNWKKNPKKIAYEKGKKFLELFMNTSLKPFYKNKVNFVSDVSIIYDERNDDNHRYYLTFEIPNKYLLSHQKMSFVLGMARVAILAVLYDDIDNMNKFVETFKDCKLDYKLYKDAFYTNNITSHPFGHGNLTTLRKLFQEDSNVGSLLFVNNNDLEKSWMMDDLDDEIPGGRDLGFLSACVNL